MLAAPVKTPPPPPSTPSDQVMEIARVLESYARRFEQQRDSRAIFTTAYVHLSRELADALKTDTFDDPVWIAQLAQVFVRYYFDAIHAYDGHCLAQGAWATVFRALEQRRTSVLEDLVLGMTAHIVNDLPQALCEVGMVGPDGVSRVRDFHTMNDVLGRAIGKVQKAVEDRYDGSLGFLDRVLESYDEVLTNYGLRISRAAGWYNAVRLMESGDRQAILDSLSRSPAITLNRLLEPPVWSLRLLVRGSRLVSRVCRRWPE
ncbi:MAG: DUF5995 family protein [Myxococcales bacterium]